MHIDSLQSHQHGNQSLILNLTPYLWIKFYIYFLLYPPLKLLEFISIKILKLSANIIAPSMTKLFNYSILNGVFPHDWQIAKVIPLYKKGLKTVLDNYRPISILPAISKAFENILYDQLYGYLSNSGILSKYQFGFRRHHSTSTALLDSTNQWYSNIDKGLINIVAFLDLKKAFDAIDHEILI